MIYLFVVVLVFFLGSDLLGLFFWLKLCLVLQIGVAKNSALFGSFAMVPILLSWVYVSWVILLVAAEVSYAAQNADNYEMESGWDTPFCAMSNAAG